MSNWKDVGTKIIDLLPMAGGLAAPFIGPAGPLLGTAIKAIAGVFGLKSADPKPEEIMQALNADPNAILKLQTARLEFDAEKMKLEFEERENIRNNQLEEFRIQLNDVQNARQREIEIARTTGKRDYSQEILGWMIVIGFFATLGVRMFIIIPPTQLENVGLLIGAMIGAFVTVVAYKFGSSRGSAVKTELLARAEPIK